MAFPPVRARKYLPERDTKNRKLSSCYGSIAQMMPEWQNHLFSSAAVELVLSTAITK